MAASVIRWPAEAIWEQVAPWLPGFTVEVLPEIDSTNTELMRRARAGQTEPVLLVAERQSAGRGRLGRSWQSAPGDSLTFSLGLPLAPQDWSGLSLAVGWSVADSVAPGAEPPNGLGLKWPNDLWLQDRKLGGILIETAGSGGTGQPGPAAARYCVVGIGLNVRAPQGDGLSTPPACLAELPQAWDAPGALAALVPPLVRTLQQFETAGFAAWVERFARRDVLRGRPVRTSDGGEGVAAGVDASGALLVHTAQGLRAIHSAEVSVRPTATLP